MRSESAHLFPPPRLPCTQYAQGTNVIFPFFTCLSQTCTPSDNGTQENSNKKYIEQNCHLFFLTAELSFKLGITRLTHHLILKGKESGKAQMTHPIGWQKAVPPLLPPQLQLPALGPFGYDATEAPSARAI